jgi:hypothetical protein
MAVQDNQGSLPRRLLLHRLHKKCASLREGQQRFFVPKRCLLAAAGIGFILGEILP